jgi:nucleoside-diphosphate-sugar epimerase
VKARILVTSAAGTTGIPTTLGLLEKGFPVRAFVRRRDARSQRLHDAGAELFVGNQFNYRDVRDALKDV